MKLNISVTGAKEIDQVLKAMPKELTHATLGNAHLAAAKPLIEKAKLLAPEGPTGNLVDAIGGVKTPIKKANVIGEVNVGPRRSGKHKGHHGHIVEFGTRPRANKKGANRGVMPKHPFMEPAFMQTKEAVVNSIATQVGKKLNSVMRRIIK